MPQIVAIIQARVGSSRLPGKIFAPINGQPIIQVIIERLKQTSLIDQLWLATAQPEASRVEKIAKVNDIPCFTGSQDDVLSRFLAIGKQSNADHLVRATGDNPFLDAAITDELIHLHLAHGNDLTSFSGLPLGTGVEIVSMPALIASVKAINLAPKDQRPHFLEHVTIFLKSHAQNYQIEHPAWEYSQKISRLPNYHNLIQSMRLTIDEFEDLTLAQNIGQILLSKKLWPNFCLEDIIALLAEKKDLLNINGHINQKNIYQALQSKEDKSST